MRPHLTVRVPTEVADIHIAERSRVLNETLKLYRSIDIRRLGARFGRGRAPQPSVCVAVCLDEQALEKIDRAKATIDDFSLSALVSRILGNLDDNGEA